MVTLSIGDRNDDTRHTNYINHSNGAISVAKEQNQRMDEYKRVGSSGNGKRRWGHYNEWLSKVPVKGTEDQVK